MLSQLKTSLHITVRVAAFNPLWSSLSKREHNFDFPFPHAEQPCTTRSQTKLVLYSSRYVLVKINTHLDERLADQRGPAMKERLGKQGNYADKLVLLCEADGNEKYMYVAMW